MTDMKPRLFTCRRCGATLGLKTPSKLVISATVQTTEPTPITCNVCNMRTFWRPIVNIPITEKTDDSDMTYTPPSTGE